MSKPVSDLITMSKADLEATIKAQVAAVIASMGVPSKPALPPSDFKIVVTRGIKAKPGSRCATFDTIRIVDTRTGTETDLFVDHECDGTKRKDGITPRVMYCTVQEPRKPVAGPASSEEAVVG